MIELVRYHNGEGHRIALVKPARKWVKVLAIDSSYNAGLRIQKVRISEQRYMTPLMRGNKPYPMNRALKGFRKFLREHGGTKGAKRLLREASSEQKEAKAS